MSTEMFPAVHGPAVATPPRRPGSVRRTSTLDTRWPDGFGTPGRILGRARDIVTPLDGGPPRVLAEDVLHVVSGLDRTLQEVHAEPDRPALRELAGAWAGGRLRGLLATTVPAELAAGTPLYLMLDDLSGATLVAGFAFRQWMTDWMQPRPANAPQQIQRRRMEGICSGFRPGSSALDEEGHARDSHRIQPVAPLADPDDPAGWHHLEDITEVSMRRARRLDVSWADGGDGDPGAAELIRVDSMFQDSSTVPEGGRIAVHEYRLEATIDPVAGTLVGVSADPRVLPYAECPLASLNVDRLLGTRVRDLRTTVLEELKGTLGCTHLNDALRALAEVPVLVEALPDRSHRRR